MARNKGQFNFSANLEVKKAAPLDSRLVVNTLAELTTPSTWQDEKGEAFLYDGLVVSVVENSGLYMLKKASGYQDLSNWIALDGAASKVEVVANLTSSDDTKALAASQGKLLSDKIETLKTSLGSALSYKGSKLTFAELPTDAKAGDVWNVVSANENTPAGTNYAWNGSAWDALGGDVDLSGYYTKDEVGTLLSNYVEKVEGSSLITTEKLNLIDTNATNISNLNETVIANTDALNLLNDTADRNGSILNIVNTQINHALEWQTL